MWFEDFHGCHDGHLGYLNRTILAILNLHVVLMPSTSFSSIRLAIGEQITTEDFQDGHHGCHLRYLNRMILAILSSEIWHNQTYHLGADVV